VAVQILFFKKKIVNVADILLLLMEALSFIYLDLITLM
jgi:hypothetical protein